MERYDVAVIGGGLVGCASAYYLSNAGAKVIIIERGQINQEASGRNAGSLHFQLEQRLLEHKHQLAKELEHYVALTQLAISHWKNLERELNCDLEVTMEGGFMVAETTAEIRMLEEKSEIEKRQGLTVELLGTEEIHTLAPYLSKKVQAALFCPDEGHCNPRLLTPAYAASAMMNGTTILTNTAVAGIRRHQEQWHIDIVPGPSNNDQLPVRTDTILNAAGAWAKEVGMMIDVTLPLEPIGLIMNVTETIPPLLHHLIQHVGRKLSMKQVEDGNVLIGGGYLAELQKEDDRWLSHRPALSDTHTIRRNLQTAVEIAPFITNLRLIRTWTGITALAPDQLPVLGEMPQSPGCFVAAGGSAFTFGPTYARLMSELILTGSTTFPIEPYTLNRFR